jgi:hypothetical protein
MRIDEFSKEELEKLSKAFSKSPLMIKKRKSAEEFFNSPQFLEFIKKREEEIKKRDEDKLKKNG